MSESTEHKMSLSVGAARPFLTPAAIAQFQSRCEFTGSFVQLISAKFHKTVFSRFRIAFLCADRQADFVKCEKLVGAFMDTCGELLKPSLGHLGCSYVELRLC